MVVSNPPIKSIEIKSIIFETFLGELKYTLMFLNLLFDNADNVWQTFELIPWGLSSNIAILGIDTI